MTKFSAASRRVHYVIAAVAVLFVAVGARLVPFADPKADPLFTRSVDDYRLHQNAKILPVKSLPVQNVHDMPLAFSDADLTLGGIAPATSDEPRKGWFTPRCAERDLRAFGVIEQLGQTGAMPSA